MKLYRINKKYNEPVCFIHGLNSLSCVSVYYKFILWKEHK